MHGDALVAVAVGEVRLVRLRVDEDLRDAAEVLDVDCCPAGLRLRLAELRDELAVLRELEDVRVGADVAADPDVALVIDRDAVIRVRPVVALARPAPVPQQIALPDRTRGRAAPAGSRSRSADSDRPPLHWRRASPAGERSRCDPAHRRRRRSPARAASCSAAASGRPDRLRTSAPGPCPWPARRPRARGRARSGEHAEDGEERNERRARRDHRITAHAGLNPRLTTRTRGPTF